MSTKGRELERTLPTSWYRSPEIYQIEKERIFCSEWLGVCREEELPQPGDHKVLDVLGESILLVRNRDGRLRAFYNVCRHRGSRLCRTDEAVAPGRVALSGGVTGGRLIVCPYHQWSYDLDGALVAAPHLGAATGFDKGEYHLHPVSVETWAGFIFLHLTPAESRPLAAQLAEIPERLQRYPARHARHWRGPSNMRCRRTGRSFVRTTMSATTAAVCTRNCARWSRRSAMRAAATWTGTGVCPHREGAYTFTHSGTTDTARIPRAERRRAGAPQG